MPDVHCLIAHPRPRVKDDTVGSGRFPSVFYTGLEITKVRVQKRTIVFCTY